MNTPLRYFFSSWSFFSSKPLRPDVIAAEILAKLQTATAAIQELQEMLEEGE